MARTPRWITQDDVDAVRKRLADSDPQATREALRLFLDLGMNVLDIYLGDVKKYDLDRLALEFLERNDVDVEVYYYVWQFSSTYASLAPVIAHPITPFLLSEFEDWQFRDMRKSLFEAYSKEMSRSSRQSFSEATPLREITLRWHGEWQAALFRWVKIQHEHGAKTGLSKPMLASLVKIGRDESGQSVRWPVHAALEEHMGTGLSPLMAWIVAWERLRLDPLPLGPLVRKRPPPPLPMAPVAEALAAMLGDPS